jgi:hypothetical protein
LMGKIFGETEQGLKIVEKESKYSFKIFTYHSTEK